MENENLIRQQISRTLEVIKNTNEMIQLQYEIEEGEFFDKSAVIQYQQFKHELLSDLKNLLEKYNLKVKIEDTFKKD